MTAFISLTSHGSLIYRTQVRVAQITWAELARKGHYFNLHGHSTR